MNASLQISLIFVNYRSARHLAAALQSLYLFEKDNALFEVIVVNNDSNESETLQTLKQTWPFLLVESGGNKGFGVANNLGAARANGSILLFINPDIVWLRPALSSAVAVFDGNRKIGVLGMLLLDENKKREAWSYGNEPCLATLFSNNIFPLRSVSQSDGQLFFPDWVSGGALFVKRELFEKIGGFDERFFLYFEDVDICKAVRRLGFLVACSPALPVIHLGGRSRDSRSLQKKQYFLSQREYFRKHRPEWESVALRCLHFIFCKM